MSPLAECLLVEQIAPRLRATSRCLPQVGADDAEEMYADGMAMAAAMLDSAEKRGKKVTAGNIAWYAGKQLASGRRSTYGGRADALCPAAQLDGNAQHTSLQQDIFHLVPIFSVNHNHDGIDGVPFSTTDHDHIRSMGENSRGFFPD